MTVLTPKLFGSGTVSQFRDPLPFSKEQFDQLALRALTVLSQFNIRPENIKLRTGDVLFDYDLTIELFNRGASIRVTAQQFEVKFTTGQTAGDREIVNQAMVLAHTLFDHELFSSHEITAFSHIQISAEDVASIERFFEVEDKQLSFQGEILFYVPDDWDADVRLVIDKSLYLVNGGLFLNWTTSTEDPVTEDTLKKAQIAFAEAINYRGYSMEF